MKEIDTLTRKLMEGTAERPSPSLNERIMRLIFQEKPLGKRIVYVESLPHVGGIVWGVVAYLAVVLVLFFYFRGTGVTGERILSVFRPYAPLFILVSGAVPLYLLGVWVEKKWLKR